MTVTGIRLHFSPNNDSGHITNQSHSPLCNRLQFPYIYRTARGIGLAVWPLASSARSSGGSSASQKGERLSRVSQRRAAPSPPRSLAAGRPFSCRLPSPSPAARVTGPTVTIGPHCVTTFGTGTAARLAGGADGQAGPRGRMARPRPASAILIHRHVAPSVEFGKPGRRESLRAAAGLKMADSRSKMTPNARTLLHCKPLPVRTGKGSVILSRGGGEGRGGQREGKGGRGGRGKAAWPLPNHTRSRRSDRTPCSCFKQTFKHILSTALHTTRLSNN